MHGTSETYLMYLNFWLVTEFFLQVNAPYPRELAIIWSRVHDQVMQGGEPMKSAWHID